MGTDLKRVCVVTGSRADYGLLAPIMRRIEDDEKLELAVAATGMHLSPEFGLTFREIEEDGFQIDRKIESLLSSDTPVGIAKAIALGMIGFAEYFDQNRPELIFVLGDRFEILAAVIAGYIARIPVAHYHGGETTYGAMDEGFRHSITKMSHWHFTSAEEYSRRVVQLGENPDRVFFVGSTGVENIRALKLLSKSELEKNLDFPMDRPFVLVTFHSVTLDPPMTENHFRQLLTALDMIPEARILFTLTNADTEGRVINRLIDDYVQMHPERAKAYTSLGSLRYLSSLKQAAAVVGNSSSGIIEAPTMGRPTVNIGDRQAGRVRAASVIDCPPDAEAIAKALQKAFSPDFRADATKGSNPYEREGTSRRIVEIIKNLHPGTDLKKAFFDLDAAPLLKGSESLSVNL